MLLTLGPTPAVQRTMRFPRLSLDSVNRATATHDDASGKSINVARVLHTLGENVRTLSFACGDRGKFLRTDLDRAGISHDFIEVKSQTRLCITLLDRATSQATELIEESAELLPVDYERLLDTLRTHSANAKILVLSGSLPPNAPQDFYARCIRAAGANVKIIVDAAGAPLLETLAMKPLLIKPNQSELAAALNVKIESDEDLKNAMREMLSRGPQWIAVTRGKAGALLSDGDQFWKFTSPEIKAVNPIGSGDAFAAGLAAGISRCDSIPDATKLAIACGAANAMTMYSGHINLTDVRDLSAKIEKTLA